MQVVPVNCSHHFPASTQYSATLTPGCSKHLHASYTPQQLPLVVCEPSKTYNFLPAFPITVLARNWQKVASRFLFNNPCSLLKNGYRDCPRLPSVIDVVRWWHTMHTHWLATQIPILVSVIKQRIPVSALQFKMGKKSNFLFAVQNQGKINPWKYEDFCSYRLHWFHNI